MTLAERRPRIGWLLRIYLALSRLYPFISTLYLRRRLVRGREDPARWRERLGITQELRPSGPLIWMHAVGVGEVMALRGVITSMLKLRPGLNFLVTSTARSSAQVFAGNLPPQTIHQYLPIDAPRYLTRFLDHWQPDLSIWSEQDLWPGAVVAAAVRGIPLALINVRMNDAAFARRSRVRSALRDVYATFGLIAAQDQTTAGHLAALGATQVRLTGSLKSAAPALAGDADSLAGLQVAMRGRKVWVLASSHAEDEEVAIAAQHRLWRDDPAWLLVIVPRDPPRGPEIAAQVAASGLSCTLRSAQASPDAAVYLADTFGELGLWYRLASIAVVGGSFGPVEGHNPWEPAALGCGVLHGARIANFAADYALLTQAGAARRIDAGDLVQALAAPDLPEMGERGLAAVKAARGALDPLARDLVELIGAGK